MSEDSCYPDQRFLKIDVRPNTDNLLVAEKKKGQLTAKVFARAGVKVDEQKAKQITGSAFRALEIARRILPEVDSEVFIYCGIKTSNYLNIAMQASQAFVDEDDPDCQVGAILHEIIENWQEDEPSIRGNNEIVSLLAEFLFTGQKRLAVFKRSFLNYVSGQSRSMRDDAWAEIAEILLADSKSGNKKIAFEDLLFTRQLSEEEKTDIVEKGIRKIQKTKI